MTKKSVEQFIGKTYREVRNMQETIRITSAAGVSFIGDCGYLPERLNITLGPDNIKTTEKSITLDGISYPYREVDGSMDDGIVISASWG